MKIYLAGKIAANDWRHDLVPRLRDKYSQLNFSEWDCGWNTTPMYRSDFHYVGPYFIGCDHGCGHGDGNHGAGVVASGCIELPYRPHEQTWAMRDAVAARCRQAIKDCDVFFAWLENPCTAFGTLVELGMAFTLGKKIVVGVAESGEFGHDNEDQWFALAHANFLAIEPTADLAFKQWADAMHPIDEERAKCESPLELAFWDAYLCRKPPALQGLIAQHPVSAGGINYRLDFALPERKIAFEIDGYTYHGKERDHFNRDRRRDLDLKLDGWDIHRFDGDLIRDDTPRVIDIAAHLAGKGDGN